MILLNEIAALSTIRKDNASKILPNAETIEGTGIKQNVCELSKDREERDLVRIEEST